MKFSSVLISRTDSIGDVVLTLPLAGYLKKIFPQLTIYFLGNNYTKDIINTSKYVDAFINVNDLLDKSDNEAVKQIKELNIDAILHVFPNRKIAKIACKAGIKLRIGTFHRIFHLLTCNKRINFSRKQSDLHEAQLNFKLLKGLGIDYIPPLKELWNYYGMTEIKPLKEELKHLFSKNKTNVILHPKSKGSAREWGLNNFEKLVKILPSDQYKIFISGTASEGELMRDFLERNNENIIDITGKLTLSEFISFINNANVLIAASTGPLHIASALGKKAIGLYPPIRPMHPERWGPVGRNACYLRLNEGCQACRNHPDQCHCVKDITAEMVVQQIEKQ